MKSKGRKKIYAGILVLALVCSVMNISAVSNAKKGKTYKLKARGTRKELAIEVGTTYQISRIKKDTYCMVLTDTSYGGVTLSELVKNKKIKWTSDSKDLKVTGSSVTAQKTGTFLLTGTEKNSVGKSKNKGKNKTKNKTKSKTKYVVALNAVSKNPPNDLDLSDAAYMKIWNMGNSVKIEDPEAVRSMCAMISEIDYTFDYNANLPKKLLVGCGGYKITIYSANETVLYDSWGSRPAYYYKVSDVSKSAAIDQYMEQLFQGAKEEQNIAG